MALSVSIVKRILGRTAFVVLPAALGCVLSIAILSHLFPRTVSDQPTPVMSTNSPVPVLDEAPILTPKSAVIYGTPVRLKIPSLNIDAPVVAAGITAEGDMQSPGILSQVSWYKFGPPPGQKGSAIIAGHYGSGRNKGQSVFDELHTLQAGSSILVQDDKGSTSTFIVRVFRTYTPDEVAADVFSSHDDKAHLNLVTCQGKWDSTHQTYSHRLVVFADKNDE